MSDSLWEIIPDSGGLIWKRELSIFSVLKKEILNSLISEAE